jgi:hypothetical protein
MESKKHISFVKKLLVLLLLVLFIVAASAINKYFQLLVKSGWTTKCVIDTYQWLFLPLTYKIIDNPIYGHILLGLDSFLIDLVVLITAFKWMLRAQSHNFPFTVFVFYLVRTCAMSLGKFPLPEPYLFEYPGFPSIFVPYDKTNDLYYSGHIGLCTIVMIECICYRLNRFVIFAFFTMFLTGFTMIVLGGHYSNDIIMGFVAASFVHRFTYKIRFSVAVVFLKIYCYIANGLDYVIISRLCYESEAVRTRAADAKLKNEVSQIISEESRIIP